MRVPGKLKRVEPNEIIVFENYGTINGIPFNAVAQTEDGSVLFFDTEHYETTAPLTFYNDSGIGTVLGYDIDCLEFARKLDQVGISPRELKDHLHDWKYIVKIVQEENKKMMDAAWNQAKQQFTDGGHSDAS